MENPKSIFKMGGVGIFIFALSIALFLCNHHWIFVVGILAGICLMIYGLITGETKFMG